jgi:hypothetical protein
MNIVNFKVDLSSYTNAECNPSDGKVRLIDGKGVIFCKIGVELLTSYYAPLNIILDYGYSSSVTKDVQIQNPPGSTYKPDAPAAVPQPTTAGSQPNTPTTTGSSNDQGPITGFRDER